MGLLRCFVKVILYVKKCQFRSFKTNIGVCFDFNERSSDELVIKMTILSPPFLLFRFWGYVGFGCFFIDRNQRLRGIHPLFAFRNQWVYNIGKHTECPLGSFFLGVFSLCSQNWGEPPPLYFFQRSVCVQGIFCFSCRIRPFDKRGE